MSAAPTPEGRVLVVADSASQLGPAHRLAEVIARARGERGARAIETVVLSGVAAPTDRQVSEAGLDRPVVRP